ncbi:MAG: protein kinase domain-containing protein [Myxococcales bacterium]
MRGGSFVRAVDRDMVALGGSSLQLGRYRLDEQVGQGGMAVVWRGFDTELKRTVAVKVLHSHLHARADIRKRFDREAQAVARLHHPHILDVYDFSGLSAQEAYLVTEFIRGSTLRAFGDQQSFDPPDLAAAALLPIAEALEHAHAAGVVHRDLKPENVMVREDGVVKLTDFGIAAILDPDEKFTATGAILGSPAHLAPETIEGKPADPRSDLFSFGTIFYWLSTGEMPFHAPTPAALLRRILEGNPKDPRLVRPSIGDAQAKLVLRCLERDPVKRVQSARELRECLQTLLADSGITEPLETLARFVKAPAEEGPKVRARIVATCLRRGEADLRAGKTTAALSDFGRVLVLDPSNEEARTLVDRVRRRARALKLARRVAVAVAVAAALGLGVVPAMRLAKRARAGWTARQQSAVATPPAATTAVPPAPQSTTAPPPHADLQTQPATPPEIEPSQTAPPREETRGHGDKRRHPPAERATRVARAPVRKEPPRSVQSPPPPAETGPAPATVPATITIGSRLPARVLVDGNDQGAAMVFHLSLAPGPHDVVVQHPCCEEARGAIQVSPNKELYPLDVGVPKPGHVKVVNADPDATVYLVEEETGNEMPLGTVRDVARFDILMRKPTEQRRFDVGGRLMKKTLEAGRVVTIDAQDGR